MGDKVKISLTNEEAAGKRISMAIGMLASRSFAFKQVWVISDITELTEKQSKLYNKTAIQIAKKHGAKWNGSGYAFDVLTGDAEKDAGKIIMSEECRQEMDDLAAQAIEHEVELIELPLKVKEKDKDGNMKEVDAEYQPMIGIALGKFIKR